ncbi:MAG: DUF1059 domain-containing protein [Gemmatimonadetes bacterium]|nr:DUF1059 domain-containing protein [Gemmatimonadota bacterium]
MTKVVHCKDVGFDCEGVIRAATEEEVLKLVAGPSFTWHQSEVGFDFVYNQLGTQAPVLARCPARV